MTFNALKNVAASGLHYLPASQRAIVESAAKRSRLNSYAVDISHLSTISAILEQFGRSLNFPIWYGANFDALFDCLSDSSWQSGKDVLMYIDGMDRLRADDPEDFATLLEVLRSAIDARRPLKKAFWILIDAPARGVAPLPEA